MQAAKSDDATEALVFLRRDRFRHIAFLKYWQAFAADTRVHVERDGAARGVLLIVPTEVSPYDRTTYPQTRHVAFLRAESPWLAGALLTHLPRDGAVLFKLVADLDIEAVRSILPLRRQAAFISFTAPPGAATWRRHADVTIARNPPAAAAPLFATQGHQTEEVADYAANRAGLFYSIGEAGRGLLAACLSFRNFEDIHEIGGLHTLPSARRRGMALRLVETALAVLGDAEITPRYQVHEQNAASIGLAHWLDLIPYVTTEHWIHAP